MPDSTPTNPSDPPHPTSESRNLPVVIPRPSEVARGGGDGWFARALRAMFGWKTGSIRSDLKDVLDAGAGETGFSPKESAMLKNILSLRERKVVDVMVPRADIVAVQQDIVLGELLKLFARAGHSRLVVYDDMLDDAVGMIHLRDLVGFMTERAAASAKATRRKKPFPAGPTSRRSTSRPRCRKPRSSARCCSPRSRCRSSTCSRGSMCPILTSRASPRTDTKQDFADAPADGKPSSARPPEPNEWHGAASGLERTSPALFVTQGHDWIQARRAISGAIKRSRSGRCAHASRPPVLATVSARS
jgi:CBS domain-containing protein